MGEKAIPALKKVLRDSNKHVAARAIWLLPHLGGKGLTECTQLLNHTNPNFQLTAYRALRRAGVDIIPFGEAMANHSNPAILRDVALSLRDLPAAKTKDIFAKLAAKVDHTDKNAVEAIGLGAANQESEIWTAIKAAMKPGAPHEWSDQFAKLTWRLWPATAVADLEARANHPSLTAEQRSFAVESLGFIDHKSSAEATLRLATKGPAKADAVNWLLRNGNGEWKKYDIAGELKKRGIYDPSKIVVSAVTAPKADPSKFSVADVLKLKGDPEKGKATSMRCIMCHEFNGTGINFGPNLKGWGEGQTLDVIARSIVEPSADISHGYSGTGVALKKGGHVHGIASNDGDPLIMTSTGGITQMIPRDRIKSKRPYKLNYSLMLSADQLGLTAQDVADLVTFLKVYK